DLTFTNYDRQKDDNYEMELKMIKRKLLIAVMGMTLLSGACSSNKPGPATPAAPATPAPAATAPAATHTTATGKTKVAESSPKPDSEKKTVPAAKKVEVPANWVTLYDEDKGYEFEVPDGSKTDEHSVEGVDVYSVDTPAPSSVQALIMAYKNKELT